MVVPLNETFKVLFSVLSRKNSVSFFYLIEVNAENYSEIAKFCKKFRRSRKFSLVSWLK